MENTIRYRCRGETDTTFFDPHKNGEWVKASDHERREIYLKQKMACPYCKSGAGDRIAELEAQLTQAETILDAVNAMEFGGIYCDDVDGENWFDARDKFLAKYRKGE
jgi:hypothetical protein